jgi:hypothetical protein
LPLIFADNADKSLLNHREHRETRRRTKAKLTAEAAKKRKGHRKDLIENLCGTRRFSLEYIAVV